MMRLHQFFRATLLRLLGQGVLIIIILLPIESSAYTCVSGAVVRSKLTVTVLNSTAPCAAGQWAVLSPAEVTAYQQALTDIAALKNQVATLQAGGAGTGTVFDPVLAASLWMFAITMILGCWLLARNAGIIIDMIKRW